MKKLVAFVLSAALLLGLTACGGKKENGEDPNVTPQAVDTTPTPEAAAATPTPTPTPEPTPTPKPSYRIQSALGFADGYAMIRFYDEVNRTSCAGFIDEEGRLQYYVASAMVDDYRSRKGYLYLNGSNVLSIVTPEGEVVTHPLGENLTLMLGTDGYAVIQEYKSGFEAVEYVYHIYDGTGEELTTYSSGAQRAYNIYYVGDGTFLFLLDMQGEDRNAYGYYAYYGDIYFAGTNTWLKNQVVSGTDPFNEYSYKDGIFMFRGASRTGNSNTHPGEFTYTDNKGKVRSLVVPEEAARQPKYLGHSDGLMLFVDAANNKTTIHCYDVKAGTWAGYEGKYVDRMVNPTWTVPAVGEGYVAIALQGADGKTYTMLLDRDMKELLDSPVAGAPNKIYDGKLCTMEDGTLCTYDLEGKLLGQIERFDTYANQLAEEIMLGGQNEYFLLDGSLAFGEIDYSTGKEVALPTK